MFVSTAPALITNGILVSPTARIALEIPKDSAIGKKVKAAIRIYALPSWMITGSLVKKCTIPSGAKIPRMKKGIMIAYALKIEKRNDCFIRSSSRAPKNCAMKIAAAASTPLVP